MSATALDPQNQSTIHDNEVEIVSQDLQDLLDAKVQKIFASEESIGLELFKKNKNLSAISYLWFDLNQNKPCIVLLSKIPNFLKLKKSTPVLLFLRAHVEGKRISEILHLRKKGRVLEFQFGYETPAALEIRLFPHGANAIVQIENKKISLHKIQELKAVVPMEQKSDFNRNLAQISKDWLAFHSHSERAGFSKEEKQKQFLDKINEQIEKKKSVLKKVDDQIQILQDDNWKKTGDFIKSHQNLDVPVELLKYIDKKKKLSANIQICFEKAKKNKDRLVGTLQRKSLILKEIEILQQRTAASFQEVLQKQTESDIKNKKKSDKSWKGYRMHLNDQVEAFVGKNATENLEILRYSQSWDYWLHLKDYPGAHGIIRRSRNHVVADEDLKKVAQFIAEKSKKSFHHLKSGDSFEVLIAECRFVRPLKGDKLGRVTYTNVRVLNCRMK